MTHKCHGWNESGCLKRVMYVLKFFIRLVSWFQWEQCPPSHTDCWNPISWSFSYNVNYCHLPLQPGMLVLLAFCFCHLYGLWQYTTCRSPVFTCALIVYKKLLIPFMWLLLYSSCYRSLTRNHIYIFLANCNFFASETLRGERQNRNNNYFALGFF